MDFINPTKILSLFLKNRKWLEWEPETIWQQLDSMFPDLPKGQPEFPRHMKDVIMACKLCITNNMAWEQWNVFEKVVMSFNNKIAMFHILQKPSLGEVLYAIKIMNKIKANEFSDEVKAYIASVAKSDGFIYLPEELAFAQNELNLITPDKAKDRTIVEIAWKACRLRKQYPLEKKVTKEEESDYDDSLINVQCGKLLAASTYAASLLKGEEQLEKLGSIFSSVGDIGLGATMEIDGFSLNKDELADLAKYISLSDRQLAIQAAREGAILTKHENNLRNFTDKEIEDFFKVQFDKTPEQIGAIFREMYTRLDRSSKLRTGAAIGGGLVGGYVAVKTAPAIAETGKNLLKTIMSKMFG